MLSTVWIPQRCSRSYREEAGRRQRWPGGSYEESKGERQIQPVISSLSVLHHLEHTKRVTELGREEKWEGGDRGDMVEKNESTKRERAVKPVISLPSKNGY